MAKTVDNIIATIGNTPLIKINKISKGLYANIFVKAEFFNPLSSIKDRIGFAMIEDAEKNGKIGPGATIVEPTSGNTGIALAFVCAQRGYKLILTMPETMSIERRALLKMLGAEIVLTESSKGMSGAILKAEEILKSNKNSYMPNQFENPINPKAHKKTTAVEIWDAMGGNIDAFVSSVGSGGTITGVGEFLKEKNSKIKVVAVEPKDSPVLSGGKPGEHKIQGIGAGFVPSILNRTILDEIILVSSEDAGNMVKELAKEEGLLAGISSGANLWAAMEIAKRPEMKDKNIVTVLCDSGERYISTWLFKENN